MIDKKSLHFKIAAYSLKYPKRVYLGLGGVFFVCIIGTLILGSKFGSPSVTIQEMPFETKNISTTNNWVAKKKWATSERSQCIVYEHALSKDRIVSCYKKLQSGDWVFEYSY